MTRTRIMLAATLVAAACAGPGGEAGDTPPIAPNALASAAGPGGGGGEEETGNNLAVPVLFPDGIALMLRGTMLEATLGGAFTNVGGTDWYHQQDLANTWQSENLTLTPGVDPPLYVDWVDWGDNLEAKDWSSSQPIRVETSLAQTLTTAMQGFTMSYLAGEGPSEMWGSNGVLYDSFEALVYSGAARLTIQRLTQHPLIAELTWDPATSRWVGDAAAPCFTGGAWESVDGPGGYGAEINVSGKIVYGYNWSFKHTTSAAGIYRLTFSLDAGFPGVLNTFFDAETQIKVSEEEGEVVEEGGGGVPAIVPELNLTYIDVRIDGGGAFPPSTTADFYATAEETGLTVPAPGVLANDVDADSAVITAVLVNTVQHGTLALAADGGFTYTPAANFHGSDSFAYKANDGALDSPVTAVNIDVAPVNDPPVATDDGYTTVEDTELIVGAPGVLANDADPDVDVLTVALLVGPAHGELTFEADGSFRYEPATHYEGLDTFTYAVSDGVFTDSASVLLTVTSVNDMPIAMTDAFDAVEDTTLAVAAGEGVLANDVDVDAAFLTATLVSNAVHGALSLEADGSFEYVPEKDFFGTDSFSYVASDGVVDSQIISVAIAIAPVNDPPGMPATLSPEEDETFHTGKITFRWTAATDVEGEALGYQVEVLRSGAQVYFEATAKTSITLEGVDKLDGGTYEWRVRATDASSHGEWTPESSFRVKLSNGSDGGWGCNVGSAHAAGVAPLLLLGGILAVVVGIRRRI